MCEKEIKKHEKSPRLEQSRFIHWDGQLLGTFYASDPLWSLSRSDLPIDREPCP